MLERNCYAIIIQIPKCLQNAWQYCYPTALALLFKTTATTTICIPDPTYSSYF